MPSLPATRVGTGPTPLLCVGMGTLMLRTMSPEFYETFTAYACDAYWIGNQHNPDACSLTMDDYADDINSINKQLGLENPVYLGHSCFGILAAHAALRANRSDVFVAGVIGNATPTGWNDDVLEITAARFEETATDERKAADKKFQAHYETVKVDGESEVSLNAYERDTARYWSHFEEVTRNYLETLWADVEADDPICDHFWGTVLPRFDLLESLHQLTVPMLVLGGEHDYDSAPTTLWGTVDLSKLPTQFSLVNCGHTGHWPNLEARPTFDQAVLDWAGEHLSNSGTSTTEPADTATPQP